MITRFSPIFYFNVSGDAFDVRRARILVDLCRSRMSLEDISLALNCDDYAVRSLLSWPFRPVSPDTGICSEDVDLHTLSLMSRATSSTDAGSDGATLPNPERVADDLAIEICRWAESFEAGDAERQQAIEYAGLELDKNSTFWKGNYLFEPYRVTLEIIGNWKPLGLSGVDQDFRIAVGRRLAAWICFWIADPEIWNPALDLAYAHFGQIAQAA